MIVRSTRFDLLPLEKQKLRKSLAYGVLAVCALGLAQYLQQYGLPKQIQFISPFVPVIVNFLITWAGEHTYNIKG